MSGMPLDTAAIMSTVLEGILYGFSILMFVGTMWTLTHKNRTQAVNRPIATVAILLLLLSTAHMIVDIVRIEEGLVKYRHTFKGGPPAFFADVAQVTFVTKNAIYIMQTLLGDGVVIYRCYVVWQSMLIIILPSILWCITGFTAVYSISQATSNAGNIFAPATGQWIQAFFASTLSTNLLSSGLLAYRIWMIECSISTSRTRSGSTMPVLRVLVDAALLYSVTLLPALVCFICSNNGQFVMIDLLIPIISIAFYMVLIRIAIRRPQSYLFRGGGTSDTERGNRQHAMKPLQVHISQFTQNDINDGTSPYSERPSTYKQEPDAVSE
ncbi:hypothetical protein K503DRAFT_374291 [Rhizopogon vinicolor AM-OR11-026]|uniref:Family A G protein-coupled receptor-like protein n=1 Tax=Rhizopogon vinicolor AM-OR11-026 TaxID=1314800 RepID=A0A1B7MRT6_9AGAM|nr:hypothetical protein K503DRAFT_374291 [Rhizopogon vinicolor AM-OR11-026]